MDNNRKKLFEEFPPITEEQWEEIIKADLKGADYEKKLVWKTDEGIIVKPYYTDKDTQQLEFTKFFPGEFPYVRGGKTQQNNWEIVQDIPVYDIAEANKMAIEALERGATGLCFELNFLKQELNLDLLLKDIYIQCIDLCFEYYSNPALVAQKILDTFEKRDIAHQPSRGCIGYDPLGNLTHKGNWYEREDKDFEIAKELILILKDKLPLYRILLVDGRLIREAGSTIVQEMACALSMGSEYLQRLTEIGLSVDDLAPRLQFNLSIGSNYFFEIAKIRAFRMLWAKIIDAFGIKNKEMTRAYIHATTAFYNMTLYDPYVNMLRGTTESMSAVIAGIDSLSVRPFDAVYNTPNCFSNRLARNVQIILKEEAYFDKVVDPAAGSNYIKGRSLF